MKPQTLDEKLAYNQGIMDFLDFLMPQLDSVTHMLIAKHYVEWNHRPGGLLEGKPMPRLYDTKQPQESHHAN